MATLSWNQIIKHNYAKNLETRVLEGTPIILEKPNETVVIKPDDTFRALIKAIHVNDEATFNVIAKQGTSRFQPVLTTDKGKKIPFNRISKDSVKDKTSRRSDARTTQQQELASLKYIEYAIEVGHLPPLEEVAKIYPDVLTDKSWRVSFEAQYNIVRQHLRGHHFTTYNRDGGFMAYITDLVRKHGVPQKDTWNPADVWLLSRDAKKYIPQLESAKSLAAINRILVSAFNNRDIVGISLKKTKATAHWEVTNVDSSALADYTITFVRGRLPLDLKNGQLSSADCVFEMKDKTNKMITGAYRMFPVRRRGNTYLEMKQKGGIAQMGKVPKAFGQDVLRDVGYYWPSAKDVPANVKQYEQKRPQWKMYVHKILAANIFETRIRSVDEFDENIMMLYHTTDIRYWESVMMSKFQAIRFAYILSSLPKKKRDWVCTELAMLAQKKGSRFGPFVKIY